MMKLIAGLTIVASAATFSAPLAAQECTDAYVKCLNDTYHLSGWTQKLADIECLAKYTGCVAALLTVN